MDTRQDKTAIVPTEVIPDGASINEDVCQTAPEESNRTVSGMTVATTTVFIVGEMAGSGVLALPHAIQQSGWIGLLMLVVCCCVSGYNGVQLGRCWSLLQERWPEYRGSIRYPYPAIGERAVGKPMRYVVSVAVDATLFGVATVFLLLASQNVSKVLAMANIHISPCYWLIVMAAILTPATWLGTPKDFWPIAVGASSATALACILMTTNIAIDGVSHSMSGEPAPTYSPPSFGSFFLAFGAILFSFGGASTFPTIQNDMRAPQKFSKVIVIGYTGILCMYFPVSLAGYLVYGDNVAPNIIDSMSRGGISVTIYILITGHLLLAFVIALNPFAQELEEVFKVPKRFHWSRCLLRTIMVLCVLFVAESIPHFSAILALVGGSTVTFLTFVAPSLFYLRLMSQKGEWSDRPVSLHVKVVNIEIIIVGIIGGIASTYSAINDIASSSTFIPPCYVNITAASG